MLYTIAFKIHIYISTITLLAGIITLVLSIQGWAKKREYSRADEWASVIFSIALYLQLILGFIIYFTLRTTLEGAMWEVPDTENDASLRFWAIEHIALMIFALFLTQLGRIFIKRSSASIRKFKASVFYYGISLLLILFSLSIALFFR
ncbi:MAG: hypothetical protein KAR19_15630 [Bacteroidales bacterium]|nr:hypothetical protein [Bacteroidales bacterium]